MDILEQPMRVTIDSVYKAALEAAHRDIEERLNKGKYNIWATNGSDHRYQQIRPEYTEEQRAEIEKAWVHRKFQELAVELCRLRCGEGYFAKGDEAEAVHKIFHADCAA